MTNVKYFQLFIAINVSWTQLFIAVWMHNAHVTLKSFFIVNFRSEVTCGQVWWPILGICALHLTHPKCTHTRSSGQPFMLRRPGSSWGSGALFKGTSVVVLWVKRALYIQSPHLQYLLDLRLEPSGYKSDSLTIRPRLPFNSNWSMFVWFEIKT